MKHPPLLFSLCASLLLGSVAGAQDVYRFDAQPQFGGSERFQVELTVDGATARQRLRTAENQPWGPAATGVVSRSGRYMIVRYTQTPGLSGPLQQLLNDNGETALSPSSLAYFWKSGDDMKGALRLADSQRQMWTRLDGFLSHVRVIPDRATFELLSERDNVPGAMGVREVKYLGVGINGASPVTHFFNTKRYKFHLDFALRGLGLRVSHAQFNAQTYFTDNRRNVAGTLIAHDNYEHPQSGKGVYTVEFWPTDPVKARHVAPPYHATVAGLPFASSKVYFHPSGETQQGIYRTNKADFDARNIRAIATHELFANVTYTPLNLGEGFGVLRLMDGSSSRPASVRDVVIFKTIPNDLSHVSGVITELPQTPLSHINLKAKQNNTPNAYIKGVSDKPEVQALLGKLVHYKVTPDGYVLEAATQADADAWFEKIRPVDPQTPGRDLTVKTVLELKDIGHANTAATGAKAANLAELRKLLPVGMVPNGFAVPFHYYDAFMKHNGFYEDAKRMIVEPTFKADPAVREQALSDFRRRVRRGNLPPGMQAELDVIQAAFPAGTPLRCRSSTNNEDLKGFNGAGLYDSHTHRPNEGHIANTLKQVWSKLWTYRAFEERDFYRIDHMSAAMGVLVHPNFDDEQANGVAVTKNIYDINWPGFYVNVQAGESLVTNPDAGATPDEFLVAKLGENFEYETQYIQRTNQQLPAGRTSVLTADQIKELVSAMEKIQAHFKVVYKAQNDPQFAMDIEFKITRQGQLIVKQARPWVD